MALPASYSCMDPLLCETIEELSKEGEARAVCEQAISGLHFFVPALKGHLRASWALIKYGSVWSLQ